MGVEQYDFSGLEVRPWPEGTLSHLCKHMGLGLASVITLTAIACLIQVPITALLFGLGGIVLALTLGFVSWDKDVRRQGFQYWAEYLVSRAKNEPSDWEIKSLKCIVPLTVGAVILAASFTLVVSPGWSIIGLVVIGRWGQVVDNKTMSARARRDLARKYPERIECVRITEVIE